MATPDNRLLSHRLRSMAEELDDAADETAAEAVWARMDAALADHGAEDEVDVALPVLERSREELQALFDGWDGGRVALPAHDKAVLKRAMKAFRKRLKLERLDDESSASRNPLSKGERSGIVGIRPPDAYGPEVWALLVRLRRLRQGEGNLLEPAGG